MDIKLAFAKTLKRLRIKNEMSQEALAFESELSANYLGEIERALKEPSLTSIFKICKALKMHPHEFVHMMEKRIKNSLK